MNADEENHRNAKADALVGEIRRQGAGRLTLFLGSAPGVGKTYAMLSRARELQLQGEDIVVGIVETHGRAETATLLEGLTVIPRKRIFYQNHRLEELDIDAVLARRPRIALIDELAHRNVPGSRHERRWQDVIDLLDAGIDVYTTVNIQHLESLNDKVYQITGIRVSETVPDVVFDRLRDIRLVDLPPRELIERLNQGKVYLPEQAEHALQAFFSPSNLIALRELAMQTAADRVDSDFRESLTARGESGVALNRRVLVAIDGRGDSEYMVRAGRRIAERRAAPWIVITVQTGKPLNESRQSELDRAFALARNLGAETEVLHGSDIVDAMFDYAARSGISTIVLGRARERPLARMFNRTLTQRILQYGAHYELTIISTPKARKAQRNYLKKQRSILPGHDMLLATLVTVMATLVAWLAEQWLELHDVSMVFIVAVVLVAARTRMAAAAVAATLCFFAYNFFFIEPRFTFFIEARQGVITVLLFLAAALIAGRLASKLRMQVLALRASNTHATVLQDLGQQLSEAADLGQVLHAGRTSLERYLNAKVWLRIWDVSESSDGVTLETIDRGAIDWVMSHGQQAGRFTDTLAGASWWFLPLQNEQKVFGAVGLRFGVDTARLTFEQRRLAEGLTDGIAQAALRTRLVADLETARVGHETERLRSALLTSVSHDLRSPLTAMIGSANSLINYSEAMSAEDRKSLLDTILLEGERLDRYIQNLLDMTRLGHTGLNLRRDWIGVDELIGSATGRLRRYQPGVKLEASLATNLRPLWVHPALVEQALFNVLENAAKFSPPDAVINVSAKLTEDKLQLDIRDHGPGMLPEERSRVFDMFYTVKKGDRGHQGTGLGLTIAQGMIGAHGGTVEALPVLDGSGTLIRICLPLVEPPSSPNKNAD